MRDEVRQALAIGRSSTLEERTIDITAIITDPAERHRIFIDFVDQFNERHGPDSPWPKAVLEDWVARSPLAKISLEAAD